MESLISVIVPIYKVEKYLDRCVRSIVNQTYKNLEIILVDDGSPDNCPKMCEYWVEKDNRIKVIHKENGGLSDARNVGVNIAKGEYISFIDSDDYVSWDFFEVLYKTIKDTFADIVECSVVNCYENGENDTFEDDLAVSCYKTEEALAGLIAENPFRQHVWNKLYKTTIAKKVLFPVGKLNEDEFWTYQAFGQATTVTRINKTMYYYLQRSGSIMGAGYNIRRLDALEAKVERQQYIEENFPLLSTQAKLDLFGSCIFAYQCVLKHLNGKEKHDAIDKIKKYKKNCNLSISEIMDMNNSSKKYYLFSKISFYLCCKFRAVANIGF